ncbi:glycosyltransferase family 39 protein [Pseudorhodoplanes sp.]|uniref:glycosyltransferase family 39 protein n=1 Tax=Pseudorhodoplanes sp. TaxID=1934341 RepID=UPI00391A1714
MPVANVIHAPSRNSSLTTLLWLFLFALTIRWGYALIVYATMGDGGIIMADGRGYMTDARKLVTLLQDGALHGGQWLGVDISTMPVFSWLLGLNVLAFGDVGALTYVLTQGLIDSATCLLIYGMAATVAERFALPAGIAAAVNPTQIVLSGLVYTDTPFLFFVALMLYGSLRWLYAPSLRSALLIGIGIGGAALTRILIVPWAPVVILFLIAVPLCRRSLRPRHFGHAAAIAAIVAICLTPILMRNVLTYGHWSLTSQGGVHLAYWVVPLVKEAKDGTPWEKTSRDMARRVKERFPTRDHGPFEESRQATEVGREALAELGHVAIVKAWIIGAAINVASPAVILSPPVSQLPRTGFYGTQGASPAEKVFNFVFRSDNRAYAMILIFGIIGVALIRLIQLAGLVAMVPIAPAAAILFVLWVSFVLAVNGPVASPKYRLPIEPVLCVSTGAGFVAVRNWWRRRKAR